MGRAKQNHERRRTDKTIEYSVSAVSYFCENTNAMNALRQIITTTDSVLTIPLPEAYQQRRVEVIIIDLEEAGNALPPHLDTPENRLKIREKDVRSARLRAAMDALAAEAAANGITEEILNEILNDPHA
jgi:hypothetical protein